MRITKQTVADRLTAFLRHDLSLAELVDWAENAVFGGDIAEDSTDDIMDVLTRLGAADVREFSPTWDEVESLLRELGYKNRIEVTKA